jgi:hypothetical protein
MDATNLAPSDSPVSRRTVYRRLAYVASFLLLVFAGDRGIAMLLDRLMMKSQMRFARLYRGEEQADIVVIGNSRGMHSFHAPTMAAETGSSVLNLSYSALSTEICEALLADYLDRNRPPKLLIIEPSGVRCDHKSLPAFKTFASKSDRIAGLLARHASDQLSALRYSHLYAYNSDNFLRSLLFLNKSDQHWILGEKLSVEEAVRMDSDEGLPGVLDATPHEKENLAALRRMVVMAHARGVKVKLVMAPLWPGYVKTVADYDSLVASIRAAAGTEASYHDYATRLDDPDCFADRAHTNGAGANELLKLLRKDHFFLPADRLAAGASFR